MTWTYQPTDAVQACNLCGSQSRDWSLISTRDRANYPATSVICNRCGLIFITPRMSAEQYADFYASGQYRQTVEIVTGRPYDEDVMRAAVAELMRGDEHSLRLSHKSRTGKYTSLELEIIARDEAHRLETYAALKRHGTFKFVF